MMKSALKNADNNTLDVKQLRETVVLSAMEKVRLQIEAYFDHKLEKNSKIKVKKGRATLRTKNESD